MLVSCYYLCLLFFLCQPLPFFLSQRASLPSFLPSLLRSHFLLHTALGYATVYCIQYCSVILTRIYTLRGGSSSKYCRFGGWAITTRRLWTVPLSLVLIRTVYCMTIVISFEKSKIISHHHDVSMTIFFLWIYNCIFEY